MTIKPGEPVTWMGLTFETNEEVLVPRAETELLARHALELLPAAGSVPGGIRVLDVCCGAGNLACALAHHRPDIRVWATDLTDACVALTRRNVTRLELGERVTVVQGDLFSGLANLGLEGTVAVIVANPPYISTSKLAGDSAHLLSDQPREAFDAGPYGFAIHKRLISESIPFFREGDACWLAMEIGLGQEKQIESLFNRVKRWDARRLFNNEEGAPRAVAARLLPASTPA